MVATVNVLRSQRPAAVAGTFYPGLPQALRDSVLAQLGQAAPAPADAVAPKMLVVPHAGHLYSGAMAARAYARLLPWAQRITRVVLLGPVHRVPVRGLVAPTVSEFHTPLGIIPVDTKALLALQGLPQFGYDDSAHAQEHSLEVQLPFLQAVLGPFSLVPLAVGEASPAQVAEVLQRLWGGQETLVVISTDLSHFHPYDEACRIDAATVARIERFEHDLHPREACGARPLNGALALAQRLGLHCERLGLCNSGDTAGPRDRVVGYAALAFSPAPAAATTAPAASAAGAAGAADNPAELGRVLLAQARAAIAARLGLAHAPAPQHPALAQPGAVFVTLQDAQGRLRGCIGSLQASRPLGDEVREHACHAAFDDPRFKPLHAQEWPGMQVEVSLLAAPQPVAMRDEADARALLRPGVDGVILQWRGRQATFLPQVWQQLPDAGAFLAALKRKAGIDPATWAADMQWQRYTVAKFT